MRFTSLAVILCSLQCLVWALPLMQSTGQTLVRRGKAVPYSLSMVQHKPGTEHEHWALHFHPTHDSNAGETHLLHAVSHPPNNGVLATDRNTREPGYTPKPDAIVHHLHDFATKTQALDALNDAKKHVSLEEPYPDHNCVDFTCQAVHHMANHGHIPHSVATTFEQHYNAHEATVRKNTDTKANREAAGKR